MIKSNITKQFAFSITLFGAIAFSSSAFADSGASNYESAQQINAANELLRKGEIDQAIEGYGNVANSEANRDELKYNMAVAQYRKSDIPAATSLFAETAGSSDASIAALSRFNLGNCLYATALQTAEQDKPAAIEQLRTAISHFRGSLRSMPDNEDARANIELAAELIRKLEDKQKQEEEQQQQQDQQQQDQEQQDQQQQDQDQQNQDEQQQNQDEQNRDSQDSQSQGSKSDQSQQDDQQKEQSDESKSDESKSDEQRKNESEQSDSENKSDESQQQQSQDAAEQQSESTSQPNSEQNQAEKPQQTQNRQSRNDAQQSREDEASLDEQPQDNQPVPTGELTAADEQDDNKEPNGSVAMADPNAKDDGLMTKEEALKMLQAVRDRDMLRRLRQQQRERSRNVRVDRDW